MPISQDIIDEKLFVDDITLNEMQEFLNKLPLDQRFVLQLRIVEGYSRRETAKRMGRSEDAVRGLQYRAIQTLRELM
ncbi:MAG: sigma-70 family RNA polymerase sigma factor, partial [Bacillota bacterium]|nr:sigma-70 family RNA polymerase sigma factor [Bacillota bacterium]